MADPRDNAGPAGTRIDNAGSNPDGDMRRSGGSRNDPHGGHHDIDHERRGPTPNPIEEMVPAGHASVPPGQNRDRLVENGVYVDPDVENSSFTETQVPNLPDGVIAGDEHEHRQGAAGITQPGFGPSDWEKPALGEGNPDLGIDPTEAPEPSADIKNRNHEGM
jgi:hypothetical protein